MRNRLKRILIDVMILLGILLLFLTESYSMLPPPLQLVTIKAILVSAGVVHAHIVRKLMFDKVDWKSKELQGNHYVSIAFYIVLPICYAFGG